jgi:hypothetical protein
MAGRVRPRPVEDPRSLDESDLELPVLEDTDMESDDDDDFELRQGPPSMSRGASGERSGFVRDREDEDVEDADSDEDEDEEDVRGNHRGGAIGDFMDFRGDHAGGIVQRKPSGAERLAASRDAKRAKRVFLFPPHPLAHIPELLPDHALSSSSMFSGGLREEAPGQDKGATGQQGQTQTQKVRSPPRSPDPLVELVAVCPRSHFN